MLVRLMHKRTYTTDTGKFAVFASLLCRQAETTGYALVPVMGRVFKKNVYSRLWAVRNAPGIS